MRKHPVGLARRFRRQRTGGLVKHEQHHADQQEQRELRQDHHAAAQQRPRRLPRSPRAQIPLHHQLIRPVRRRRQKRPTDHARPKRVAAAQIEREVEQSELVQRRARRHDLVPAAGNPAQQNQPRQNRAGQIHPQLNRVGPDHRRHPAQIRVGNRHRRNQQNRNRVGPARERHQHQRRQKQPDAVGDRARGQKQRCCGAFDASAEAPIQHLIHREKFAPKIQRQQHRHDDEPPEEVTEHQAANANAGTLMNVTVEVSVATIEAINAHHGTSLDERK